VEAASTELGSVVPTSMAKASSSAQGQSQPASRASSGPIVSIGELHLHGLGATAQDYVRSVEGELTSLLERLAIQVRAMQRA